jgi:hypothetical protein
VTIHKQVWVKVNAPVDEGMAALISALSVFPKLRTIESCQGTNGRAWLCFEYGETWQELAEFVLGFLGPKLTQEFGDCVDLSIRVAEAGMIQGEMDVASASVPAIVSFLEKLRGRGLAVA